MAVGQPHDRNVYLELAHRRGFHIEHGLVGHLVLPGHEVHRAKFKVVRREQVFKGIEMTRSLTLRARGSPSYASVARGVVDLNANPWLHRNRIHGVAGPEGSSPRIDVHVISRSSSNPAGYRAKLPRPFCSRIEAANLPVDPPARRGPGLASSLSRCNIGTGGGAEPRSPAILEKE